MSLLIFHTQDKGKNSMITMCSTKRRIYLRKLQELDKKRGSSNVRLIEMIVDKITNNDGYSMQFWKDVEICGLREAIMYLHNQYPVSTELIKIYNEIAALMSVGI